MPTSPTEPTGMLAALVHFSLRFRGVVLLLALTSLAYGAYVAVHARFDVFPEFAAPQVVIQSEAPGLSAEQVEQLVTRPLENALNGVPELESIRSQSIQGVAAVSVIFRQNADVFRIRQMVGERLTTLAGELPEGVKAPRMGALTSSTSMMLAIGITSDTRTPLELRGLADWTLEPRLLGVPGVSKVEIFGGQVRQFQIRVHPDRLLAHGLDLETVIAAARNTTGVRGAGFIDTSNQRIVVRTDGQALRAADLGDVIVTNASGTGLRLSDVADVVEAYEPKFGDAQVMGKDAVLLLVHAQYGANTIEVTKAVEAALDELTPALKSASVDVHPRLFRPASFIERSLANLRDSLLLGGLLVVVVLFFFQRDLRTALISFASIPLSLLAAITVLDAMGSSINTITLGGLAIAIGVVVDDAIIDVDNILRRLRERAASVAAGEAVASLATTVLHASLEVRSAVVYASLIVALVFLPVLAMSGVSGRLFAPLATSFILAVLASLLVALTVTPALCLTMLAGREPRPVPAQVGALIRIHRRTLTAVSRRPRAVMVAAAALVLMSLAMLPLFGGEFLPEFREGHYVLHMTAAPGTSLEESIRIGKLATAALLANPHISQVAQQAGRADGGEDTWGTHLSEFHIDLAPLPDSQDGVVADEIREELAKFPGVAFDILPYLAERIEETLSGATAQVSVGIFGDDLDVLDDKAAEVAVVLGGVRGAVDVQVESGATAPEVVITLDAQRIRRAGFTPVTVLESVRAAYEGTVVAQTFDGNRVTGVAVVLDEASRRDPERVGELVVTAAGGMRAPLSTLADIRIAPSRSLISHDAARRRQQVTCNVDGRDVASFVAEAKRSVNEGIHLPQGVYAIWGGSAEAQSTARNELLVHSLLAAAGIGVLLAIAFASGRNLLLLVANLPFALVGGVMAVLLDGGVISVGTLVGFVALFGITMRNSIMLLSHYEHVVTVEGRTWDLETALTGTSERLVPILMTVLVTGLGLLPLAISGGQAGHEIEGPMAVVILGGLASSTILNLLVLPTLALRYARFGQERTTDASAASH